MFYRFYWIFMRRITEENLRSAFSGESQAYMRYMIFARKAEQEGFPNIARLFRAVAYAELVHASNHYKVLGMMRTTPENLQVAIDGEVFEVDEMYPAYNSVAKLQGETGAERVTRWALEAEKIHASLYQRAKQSADRGEDAAVGIIYVCELCGYTVEDSLPERCPICNAPKDKFREFR
jgi:rubrerythrin